MQTSMIFILLSLVSLLAIPGFLIATLVRKGQRMKMLKLAGISTLVFVVSGVVAVWIGNIEQERDKVATEQGEFESVEDYRQAKAQGYVTKEEWATAIQELEERVAKVPDSDYVENIRIYNELHKLDPDNERYEQKISFYEKKREEAHSAKQAELRRKEEEAKQAKAEAEARAKAEADAQCRQSLQCWGEKHSIAAAFKCEDAVERIAKYQAEWTDGLLEPKFSHFRWKDHEAGVVTYLGDKVKFQNGFGAWQNMSYACDYDPERDLVLSVNVQPGRL